ncbi:outer membrane lipoprotein carrier protein LolA [Kitasatospora cinereorecta]
MGRVGARDSEEGFVVEQQTTPWKSRRRTAVRVALPVAVAAAAAAGVGLVPALASDSAPNLPQVSAEQLVAKVLAADTDTFSGTVRVSADLGLPTQLLSLAGGSGLGAIAGGGVGSGGTGVAPQSKALELLGGDHTLNVAAAGPDKQRIELLGDKAGYQLVHDGDQVWAYDGAHQEALHLTAPKSAGHAGDAKGAMGPMGSVTPQELAKRFLAASAATTTVTVDGTESVAGRSAYRLSVKPAQQGSTVAEVRISVDSERGVPLGVQVRSVDGTKVLDAHFSSVSFAAPAASTFSFTPPKGAKVTEQQADGKDGGKGAAEHALPGVGELPKGLPDGKGAQPKVIGEGWTSVLSLSSPTGAPAATGKSGDAPQGLPSIAKSLGKSVPGGTVVGTHVVNVLLTDDGRIFAGAVTPQLLQSAAAAK